MKKRFTSVALVGLACLVSSGIACEGNKSGTEAKPADSGKPVAGANPGGQAPAQCDATKVVTANVVALDQPFLFNRYGAGEPGGMIFALARDVVSNTDGSACLDSSGKVTCQPGKVMLRAGKRPRPLVLRVNQGDCLSVNFTNLLYSPMPTQPLPGYFASSDGGIGGLPGFNENNKQQSSPALATLAAGVTVVGLDLATAPGNGINNAATFPGRNADSLTNPGQTMTYTYYAANEGAYLLQSSGALFDASGNATSGQRVLGLFGAVHVEPAGSEWYRSQVSAADLKLATTGTTPLKQPLINYAAVYPSGTKRSDGTSIPENTPVLRMLDANREIVYSDLNAVITGPNAGPLAVNYPKNPVLPDRQQPFREFTVIYHESPNAVQAFSEFKNNNVAGGGLGPVLSNGADTFAINYGTGGIAAEVYANRIGKGPTKDCVECKFEEFFLGSWAQGDPSMIVDNPVNSGKPATVAYFPDDPSNVHHSYLNDHVRFRILHAGTNLFHVHHLHAHQWLYNANSDKSAYLDSQALGPGATFTQEITYNGSGNLNRTVGDSIFHCHFYPHFAAGMWSLWRVHDVYETGTVLDANGVPVSGARALPDAEITTGTPIPAILPLPGLPLPVLPAQVTLSADGKTVADVTPEAANPGYPFFIPGIAGHRPPHPPMDFAVDPITGLRLNGGLPRHIITSGTVDPNKTRTTYRDFSKVSATLDAMELPEEGTPVEQAAMAFHSKPQQTYLQTSTGFQQVARANAPSSEPPSSNGALQVKQVDFKKPAQLAQEAAQFQSAVFQTNGQAPQQGAPFADPCPLKPNRNINYKAANIQLDITFNKKGWHFPQERILTLWEDVTPTRTGVRAPEPLFIRANSGDCVEYWHTNLVPEVYTVDSFQVQTPTDIIGQHIHLVKFDVLAADGAANGWNYEDGTFSPGEVRERIEAINKNATPGILNTKGERKTLTAVAPPQSVFGDHKEFVGAQTTIQRWYADPILDNAGSDRTLRTVFTHDHYGPSTHQQAGLYAGLLVEPKDSQWLDVNTGQQFGNSPGAKAPNKRDDGGPTTFQAYIQPSTKGTFEPYREFALEFQDLQLGYKLDDKGNKKATPENALSAPSKQQCNSPDASVLPCPQLITAGPAFGTVTVNYRNEPLPFRTSPGDGGTPGADNTDLSHVFRSIERQDPELNQPGQFPMAGASAYDPYTPLLRTYEGEKVQVRVLVGGHINPHYFTIRGAKWLFQPSDENSGYRNSQAMGISEHFELEFKVPRGTASSDGGATDYLYAADMADPGITQGAWGILRSYASEQSASGNTLQPVPSYLSQQVPSLDCPANATVKKYAVSAVSARQVLTEKGLIYYQRALGSTDAGPQFDTIADPDGLLYVLEETDGGTPTLKLPGNKVEPLVLRANAGDCIEVQLTNKLPSGFEFTSGKIAVSDTNFSGITLPSPSTQVGLNPQLVAYNASTSSGFNVGINPVQTVKPGPGAPITYRWYAGSLEVDENGKVIAKPMELGSANLIASDPLGQPMHGLSGALIIEPAGSTWKEDPNTRLSATVTPSDGGSPFREFVVIEQPKLSVSPSSINSASFIPGFNYGTEPFVNRYVNKATASTDISCMFSNQLQYLPGAVGEPQTFVFEATAGEQARFRVLNSGPGNNNNGVITLIGHNWQDTPYTQGSTVIGDSPQSDWTSSRAAFGTGGHFDMVVTAGGAQKVPGDYLFVDLPAQNVRQGAWGILRVKPANGSPPQQGTQGPPPSACLAPQPPKVLLMTNAKMREDIPRPSQAELFQHHGFVSTQEVTVPKAPKGPKGSKGSQKP